MEETTEAVTVVKKRRISLKQLCRNALIIFLALTAGYLHYKYAAEIFEGHYHFSHLSDLEREIVFRTEEGFYYSYYKTMVEEEPVMAGIHKLMYDRLVEFPKVVNAFNRFNIHPEVILGILYKYFEPTLAHTKQCHTVYRGPGLDNIESCVGLGHPIYFYLEGIWVLAGTAVAAVFVHAVVLSDSILGGILAVLQYFANHVDCTRVQWIPAERENMAGPLLFLQMGLLTMQLRREKTSFCMQMLMFALTCLCLLFWQFSQFIFLTQVAIFFIMEQLRIIELKTLCIVLHSHICGLHMAVLLLQGNNMLKSSLFTAFLVILAAYCLLSNSIRVKVKHRFDLYVETWLVFLRVSIAVCATFYLKKIIAGMLDSQEDGHILDLLLSKFTNYKTFHTLIYTCSKAFAFMGFEDVKRMCFTFILPIGIIVGCNSVYLFVTNSLSLVKKAREIEQKKAKKKEKDSDAEDSGIENVDKKDSDLDQKECGKSEKENECNDSLILFLNNLNIDPAIFYNLSQLAVYGVMAFLFMRLKMLFNTQLCVVGGLVMNRKFLFRSKSRVFTIFCVWILCYVGVAAYVHITREIAHTSEFSDPYTEELLEWISANTQESSAFAGSMSLMATVMLATRRPVVVHPHYEHVHVRQRVYEVYKVYGRFTAEEVYQELSKLKVSYLILEMTHCYGTSDGGCTYTDIWDVEAPHLSSRPPLCHTLITANTDHFYNVFGNERYKVFRLHDLSVRYMPRYFDT